MTVSILFKIAAVGILITVLNQVLKHSGRKIGISVFPGRTGTGVNVADSLYL